MHRAVFSFQYATDSSPARIHHFLLYEQFSMSVERREHKKWDGKMATTGRVVWIVYKERERERERGMSVLSHASLNPCKQTTPANIHYHID